MCLDNKYSTSLLPACFVPKAQQQAADLEETYSVDSRYYTSFVYTIALEIC